MVLDYITLYFEISVCFLLFATFLKGFIKLETYSLMDFIDALVWPVSIACTIGIFLKIIILKIKGEE